VKKLFAIARDWLEHKGDILRSKDIDGSCGDSAPAGSVALGAGFYAHARVLTPIMGCCLCLCRQSQSKSNPCRQALAASNAFISLPPSIKYLGLGLKSIIDLLL